MSRFQIVQLTSGNFGILDTTDNKIFGEFVRVHGIFNDRFVLAAERYCIVYLDLVRHSILRAHMMVVNTHEDYYIAKNFGDDRTYHLYAFDESDKSYATFHADGIVHSGNYYIIAVLNNVYKVIISTGETIISGRKIFYDVSNFCDNIHGYIAVQDDNIVKVYNILDLKNPVKTLYDCNVIKIIGQCIVVQRDDGQSLVHLNNGQTLEVYQNFSVYDKLVVAYDGEKYKVYHLDTFDLVCDTLDVVRPMCNGKVLKCIRLPNEYFYFDIKSGELITHQCGEEKICTAICINNEIIVDGEVFVRERQRQHNNSN